MRNNPNGQRHLSEVNRAKKERSQMAHAIAAMILEQYSRQDMIKILYMLWEQREIRFSPSPGIVIDAFGGEMLPPVLKDLIVDLYPVKTPEENTL